MTQELVTIIKHHILKMLSGPNGSDFIKTDKNQGPDVNISKLHKNFLQQYEPSAIDVETGKFSLWKISILKVIYYDVHLLKRLKEIIILL